MYRLLLLLLALPFCHCAPPQQVQADNSLTTVYTQAIADFIREGNKYNKASFDTLYIGKRANGQPDDFPDITLPATIANTQIRLVTPEEGTRLQQQRKQRTYINLMGWVEDQKAEFIFVVFSKGFEHQYDGYLNYKFNPTQKAYELDSVKFKGPPF